MSVCIFPILQSKIEFWFVISHFGVENRVLVCYFPFLSREKSSGLLFPILESRIEFWFVISHFGVENRVLVCYFPFWSRE